jgi:hypothetical protein
MLLGIERQEEVWKDFADCDNPPMVLPGIITHDFEPLG